VLSSHVMSGAVRFWQGDPDDVIKRYLGACKEYEIDVIVRVTGDCPVVSSDIAELLLTEHFKNGADYTAALTSAVGSSVEIYNTEALQRVINIMGNAPHSEYMTWYMRNNSNLFKNHFVNLDKNWVRDYRLTLDYDEDLEMFEQLFCELEKRNLDPSIENILTVLDENKNIVDLNQHIGLTYKTDLKLIELLDRETKIKCA
jgi:N,N'-diacetyllegionaminate synthase